MLNEDGSLNPVFCPRRFDPAAEILLEAMGTATRARSFLIDRTIRTLKQSGAWATMDGLYLHAAHDATASLINWIRPGTFNLTATNSPTFAADRGYTGDGATSCLTGPNLSSFGGMFVQDSAHMGVFIGTNVTENQADCGSANSFLRTLAAASNMTTRANDNTTVNNTVTNSSIGHSMWDRTASTAYGVYRNGALVASQTTATTGIANASVLVCAASTSFANKQVSAFHYGKQMNSAAMVAAVYSALLAYLTAVGAPTS